MASTDSTMEDDSSVSAVQCSVIQYCSETTSQTPNSMPENGNGQNMDSSHSNEEGVAKSSQVSMKEEIVSGVNGTAEEAPSIAGDTEMAEGETKALEADEVKNQVDLENCQNEVTVAGNEPTEEVEIDTNDGIQVKEEVLDKSDPMEAMDEKPDIKKEELAIEEEKPKVEGQAMKREATGGQEPAAKKAKKKNSAVNGVRTPSPQEEEIESESDEEDSKRKRRGRNKKNPEAVPAHLNHDMGLGYRILNNFLDTPLYSVFCRPIVIKSDPDSDEQTTPVQPMCLNQIKKKFDDNVYTRIEDFVGDVRGLLSGAYMQRDPVTVKKALRLEQVLEQRIAQLPSYLRPQCALILSEDEINNSSKKIRISKGGGFISLLQERAEKARQEKDREKRKVLAEERKQLKEEQDKDVNDWERNVLLKDHEEDIKSMWELLQIGHFIHICSEILNIGDISQYEVERMLIFPQCSDTLDLIMTALLSNSLMRAKLDRTPSMPYTIWQPQVRSRVTYWYRAYHREYRNPQKTFEELGVEPEFWAACGPDHNPLDYFNMHDLPLIQRVWLIKTLCDVDFVRKKTVYEHLRLQPHQELEGKRLGRDRHGFLYLHFPQFNMFNLRVYKQAPMLDTDFSLQDLIDLQDDSEERSGEITLEKVFKDIWDVGVPETPVKRPKAKGKKKHKNVTMKVKIQPTPPKSLRQSARAKRKVIVESSDSDSSDTDLATLKNKLNKPEKTFISMSVFRLPREKVKPVNVKKSYYSRKLEREEAERQRLEELEANKDKMDDDQSESMEPSQEPREEKDRDDDDDDDTKDNFSVKNLENLKMVLKKDSDEGDNATDGTESEEAKFKYTTPAHMQPDRNKFYCVVDSVAALRQLITQLSSDENDLEIINRSTLRSGKTKVAEPAVSCEVKLIQNLEQLLEATEECELEFSKSIRASRDKMYKEHTSFINRPIDFVHPNEAHWLKFYEEPTLAPPAVAPPAEPEPPPPEIKPDLDALAAAQPPSPLGSLRPRTRTRTSQVVKMPQPELEDAEEEMGESSGESDDNWELPPTKSRRRKTPLLEQKAVVSTSSRPKRTPKRNSRYSNAGESSEKSHRANFFQGSDPSEELNWEENRRKILEKHSPKKVVGGDIESEMSEIEMALKSQAPNNMLPLPRTCRILPPTIPGNKKPYFNHHQMKTLNRKDDDVEIIGGSSASAVKPRRVPSKTARPVVKRTAATQSCEVIDVDMEAPKPQPVNQAIEQFFVTDGTNYVKIEEATVQELISNQEAVRRFGDQLDLNKKIQIVKKRSYEPASSPKPAPKQAPRPIAKANESPRPGLRLIRPQNVPNQTVRPTQRVSAPQNVMYVQTSQAQAQNMVQLPQGVSPGLVQVITRPAAPTDSDNMVQVVRGTQDGVPIQFVQVSQPTANMVPSGVVGTMGHNVMRIAMTSSSQVVQPGASYVRLASTGQIVQIAQAPFKQPIIAGNLVQMQQQVKGAPQMGTLVQMASPTGAPRLVQMQTPRLQGVVQQQQAAMPQGQVVQIQRPQVATGASPVRAVQPVSGAATPRPQTTLVQVYATPRMQAATTQIAASPPTSNAAQQQMRPMTSQSVTRPTLVPINQPRMMSAASPTQAVARPVRMIAAQPQGTQATVMVASQNTTPRLAGVAGGQPRAAPAQQLVRMQSAVRANSPRPSILAHTLTSGAGAMRQNQIVTQVEIPGKPGFFQLQNAEGQTISIVQLVSSTNAPPPGSGMVLQAQPTTSMMQVQGSPVRQQLVQVQASPNRPQLVQVPRTQTVSSRPQLLNTVSSGNIMVSGGPNRPQMATAGMMVGGRPQMVQVQVTGAGTMGGYIVTSTRPQLNTQGLLQTVQQRPQLVHASQMGQVMTGSRLQTPQNAVSASRPQIIQVSRASPAIMSVASPTSTGGKGQMVQVQVSRTPTKATQVYTLEDGQPILVRTNNSPASRSMVMSTNHPVISIDEDEEMTIASSQCGEAVIDGVTYQISTGTDHVLFNSQFQSTPASHAS